MTIDEMREKLKSVLSEKRFKHSIGVMETAVKMAKHYGANPEKTAIAGLLHDCAKEFSKEEFFGLCEKYNIFIDPVSRENSGLLHGFVGAEIARECYGVDDDEIYDAIYFHTVGKPDMSLMTKIIYIADVIEPGRTFEGVQGIRDLLFEDIDKALVFQIDGTLRSLISKGVMIHTNTIDTRNFYLKKVR